MRAPKFLDKRTWDDRLYDFDLEDLLDTDEVIVDPPPTISADPIDDLTLSGLTFGTPMVNLAPIPYPKLGRVAGIGKAVQVYIKGGVIPAGAPFLMVTLRLMMVTNINPQLEATVLLRLINTAP